MNKYLSFIKEYNPIQGAIPLEEVISDTLPNREETEIQKIIDYLDNGTLLLAWMGYFVDVKTKKPIGPDSYLTDGIWIWPLYATYYLRQYPQMQIDREFLNHLEAVDYKMNLDASFPSRKIEMEMELSKKLSQ